MKTFLCLFLLCVLVSATACKKSKQPERSNTLLPSIVGKWELRESSNGWTGPKKFAPGNGNGFEFTTDKYKRFTDGKLVKEGYYQIRKDSSMLFNKLVDMLVLEDDLSRPIEMITITGNQMELTYDAYDAGGASYERQ
jgi:hypothetical protein